MKLASLALLWHPLAILVGTAVACYVWATTADPGTALAWLKNPGPHGFSEMLYEFTSAAANNGSGFEGLGDNTPFWNISTGLVMLLSRYIPIIAPLALAGVARGQAGRAGNRRHAARRQRDLRRHAVGGDRHSRTADVHAGRRARADRGAPGAAMVESSWSKNSNKDSCFTLVTMVLLGGGYNVAALGHRAGRVSGPGRGQPDPPRRRHGRRLAADRPEVHAARVLPAAAVGRGLQRGVHRRHQLRPVEPRSPEGRAGTARCRDETGGRRGEPGARPKW